MLRFLAYLTLAVCVATSGAARSVVQDADDRNSGYNPATNLSPEFVGSSRFGIQWTFQPEHSGPGTTERFMAKPLLYTDPVTRRKLLIASASSNRIYILDAETGEVLNTRQLRKPYADPNLPCGDLVPETGVLGTPVIEAETRTLYVYAKGYKSENMTGPFNAGYYLYAVDVLNLIDRAGFPALVDGPASNDPRRYFTGGLGLQRPSLKLLSGVVFAGFGGGCGSFNQTGWIAGVNATNGAITTLYATQAGDRAPNVDDGFYSGGGGGSIWQAGVGLASDRDDGFYVVAGDGTVFDKTFDATPGTNPGEILEGTVLSFRIKEDGSIEPRDHFRPANYPQLGSSSRDLGSGGVTILDPTAFRVPRVKRTALAGGQTGQVYLLNLNDLGGFRQGPNGTDKVLQRFSVPGNVPGVIYGSFGVYPREGGYIYIKPVGLKSIIAYKFGRGPEYFTLAGQSSETANTAVGSGPPVVTTVRGKRGTGIVWVADINRGLTAYHAVPSKNGTLVEIPIPHRGRPKFQRPVFAESRVYMVTTDGMVIAYGEVDGEAR